MKVLISMEHRHPSESAGDRITKTEIIRLDDGNLVAVDFWQNLETGKLIRVSGPRTQIVTGFKVTPSGPIANIDGKWYSVLGSSIRNIREIVCEVNNPHDEKQRKRNRFDQDWEAIGKLIRPIGEALEIANSADRHTNKMRSSIANSTFEYLNQAWRDAVKIQFGITDYVDVDWGCCGSFHEDIKLALRQTVLGDEQ